jgi:hypothetical protein
MNPDEQKFVQFLLDQWVQHGATFFQVTFSREQTEKMVSDLGLKMPERFAQIKKDEEKYQTGIAKRKWFREQTGIPKDVIELWAGGDGLTVVFTDYHYAWHTFEESIAKLGAACVQTAPWRKSTGNVIFSQNAQYPEYLVTTPHGTLRIAFREEASYEGCTT